MAREQKRLAEAVEDYLRFRRSRGFAEVTVLNEGYILRRFVAWYGDVQLRHMTPIKVADWFYGPDALGSRHRTRDGRHRAPIKPSTHNYYMSRLKAFFRFCSTRGWMKRDLLEEVSRCPQPMVSRRRPSEEQLASLIEATENDRDRAYITTLLHTGLRRADAARIRLGDVDLSAQTITVFISKSKTEDAIPITARLDRELRRWLLDYEIDLGRDLQADDLLFPAKKTGGYRWVTVEDGSRTKTRADDHWCPDKPLTHPERIVHDALEKIGIDAPGEGAHTLRRAAARALFEDLTNAQGYDSALRVVSAFLHHKNSTTTEHYLGLDPERLRRDKHLRGKPFLEPPLEAVVIDFPGGVPRVR